MYGTELAMFSTASAVSTLVYWCFNLYPCGSMLNAEMPQNVLASITNGYYLRIQNQI